MSSSRIKSDEIQMGDNYVLPIEQTRVTRQQAKVQQIIDETDAKARQIIDNAETKSQVVIQAANTEAESIIANAKKKAEQEYDKIKEQAYQEGFKKGEQDGLYKFQNDAQEALKSLDTLSSSSYEIKKNIIDLNKYRHPDISSEEAVSLIAQALYSPEYIVPGKREGAYHFISQSDGKDSPLVLLDIEQNEDGYFDIVHFFKVRERGKKALIKEKR